MNKIVTTISKIHNIDNLNIVEFEFNNLKLKMISLDLDENMKIGQKVVLTVKPTHIAIARNLEGDLSFSNQLNSTITEVIEGKILTVINAKVFDTNIQSIITTDSSQRMNLKTNDNVTLLIKASDVSIWEVLND